MKSIEINPPLKANKVDQTPLWQREIQLGSPIKLRDRQQFYHQWALLLQSGMSIRASLTLMQEQLQAKHWPKLLQQLKEGLEEGLTLADCFAKQTEVFSQFEVQAVRVAEQSGKLSPILQRLAAFFAKRQKLRRKLRQALSYPLTVVGIAGLVLAFMLGFVVPMFADIFARFDAELPPLTRWIMQLAAAFSDYSWYVLLLAVGLILATWLFRHDPLYQFLKTSILVRTPIWGKILIQLELARISHSLAALLHAHIPLDQALRRCAEMAQLPPFQKALTQVLQKLMEGESLGRALQSAPVFPPYYQQMVRIGEESARLPTMMDQLAEQLETESESKITQMTQLLEPMLILALGAMVAVILLAMYLPMFSLSQAMVR
jgi:type IV pilus assembly protein PilC